MRILHIFPFNKGIHLGFGMMFLIILTTLVISLWSLHKTVATFESVIHKGEVSDVILRVFVELKEAEDQQREFLLTGEPRFLDLYHQAVEATRARLMTLENLVMTQGEKTPVFSDFQRLILARLDRLQNILDTRESQGNQASIDAILAGEGMRVMNQIRQFVLESHKEDVADFTSLHHRAHTMETFSILTMTLGILLTFAVFLFTLWKIQRDLAARQQLEKRLLEEAKLAEISRRIADIGHDVKNMLTPIQMGMNLLEEELDGHFQRTPAAGGDKSPGTQELCKDIISMTRRGSGRIQERVKEIADAVKGVSSAPQFAACQVGKIIEHVLEALRFYAEEREIHLHTKGLETLPTVQAYEQRFFNAFYNLVNNAIPEVSPGGSVTITGALSLNGKGILLSFKDTGRGMSPEVLQCLFTYHVVSRKPGGTGLGTKIVKDVVDIHGGTISVESTEGQGTTFTICLPIEGPVALAV